LPESADVAIIGAGFTGLSAALALAKRGAKVVVLESETIGWGASSRNGGMVLTGLKLGVNQLISMYGRELTRRMYAASLETIASVERIVKEENIACDFARTGHLEVACKQAHFDDYARQVEVIGREFNHQLRVVPASNSQRDRFRHLLRRHGRRNLSRPQSRALRCRTRRGRHARRGSICERTRLQNIQRESRDGAPGFRLNTSRGAIWARNVLVGTSGYTGAATPALRKKIIPIGSFIITTEVLSDKLARELSPRNRQIYDSKNYLYYYRLTPDNRMLFGGRAAFFPETDQTIRKSAEILRLGMIEVYPQLRDTKVEYVWGGTLDFCFDIMPHAGQMDGIYFALGYAGHGVAMATYQGQKMAEWIAEGKTDNPFAEIPFPGAPLGLYNGKPWFLPFAGRTTKS
jgi:glycine/D-amino acid oxidase-like deaminating enzyme